MWKAFREVKKHPSPHCTLKIINLWNQYKEEKKAAPLQTNKQLSRSISPRDTEALPPM